MSEMNMGAMNIFNGNLCEITFNFNSNMEAAMKCRDALHCRFAGQPDYINNNLVLSEDNDKIILVVGAECSEEVKELALFGVTKQEMINLIMDYGMPDTLIDRYIAAGYVKLVKDTDGIYTSWEWDYEKFKRASIYELNDMFRNIQFELNRSR